ncbi:L-lactate dehydrogenase [Clonorchis sinensis]|uniref:L-lactate dehydrogenase n=1 Tax=Clonorchis sinensis TaxID=79923 RepID=H2KV10_CLOSI|nr:L-lactate dehydrogenase [Clonorchis sinensis]
MSGVLKRVAPGGTEPSARTKITVVGAGSVGMAAAFSLMEITGELCIIDVATDKVMGEVLDLQHGEQFTRRCKVYGSGDYKDTENSDIVVITAGARQVEGETRLDLVQRNVDIFKRIIPEVAMYSPKCIIVVVSNPVDVLTYVAAKLSGFPPNRIMGTGTLLDSARFRHLLGEKLGVSANSVHAYIIGEHGDSSVPVWSYANIAGVRLSSLNPHIGTVDDPEDFSDIYQQVMKSAYHIIKLKGYTSWAIGLACRSLCSAILNNSYTIYPISTSAKGVHGINNEVYLSLPCLITSVGISHIVLQDLSPEERQKVQASAETLWSVIKSIKW